MRHPQTCEGGHTSCHRDQSPDDAMRGRALASDAWQELNRPYDTEQKAAQDMENDGGRGEQSPRVLRCNLWPAGKFQNADQTTKDRNERVSKDDAKDDPLGLFQMDCWVFSPWSDQCGLRAQKAVLAKPAEPSRTGW